MNEFDERYWKIYREERVKLVRSLDPQVKKPFQRVLTPQQIAHVARQARKKHNGERKDNAPKS